MPDTKPIPLGKASYGGPAPVTPETAKHFANDGENFKSLFDALAVGDVAKATKVAKAGGMSDRQASLIVRDSSALAAALTAFMPPAPMSW